MTPGDAFELALTHRVLRRRLAAWVVDGALIGAIAFAAWHICLLIGLVTLGFGAGVFGLLPSIPLLYTWLFVASPMGATPGMALFGLVVARNGDLGPPGPLAALVWTFLYYATLAVGAVWLAAALITVRRRTLHDLVSGLVVVRRNALTGLWRSGIMGDGGFPPA